MEGVHSYQARLQGNETLFEKKVIQTIEPQCLRLLFFSSCLFELMYGLPELVL